MAHRVLYKGQMMTAYAIAKMEGLSITCVRLRIMRGLRGDDLGKPPHEVPRSSSFHVDPLKRDMLPASKLAEGFGISRSMVYQRKRMGIPLDRPRYARAGEPDAWDIQARLQLRFNRRAAAYEKAKDKCNQNLVSLSRVLKLRKSMNSALNDVNDFAQNTPNMTDDYLVSIGMPTRAEAERLQKEHMSRFDKLVEEQYKLSGPTKVDQTGRAKLDDLKTKLEAAQKAREKWTCLFDIAYDTKDADGMNKFHTHLSRAEKAIDKLTSEIKKLEPIVRANELSIKDGEKRPPNHAKPRLNRRGWSPQLDKDQLKEKILEWGRIVEENKLDEQAVRTLKYYVREYKKLSSA